MPTAMQQITPLLILCSLLMGCEHPSKPTVSGTPLFHISTSRIQTIALESIVAKYPTLNTSKLEFDSIRYSLSADAVEMIDVTYQIPSVLLFRLRFHSCGFLVPHSLNHWTL
jgi:hypothetical protein